MPSEKQILEMFEKIEAELPGFIAASLVDLESGMTLGRASRRAATSTWPPPAPTTARWSSRS